MFQLFLIILVHYRVMTIYPLEILTCKLAFLIALVSADRGQSIAFLDFNFLKILPSKAVFMINKLTKTSRPGKPAKRVILPAYSKCKKLCVKSTLQCYIDRTKQLRSSSILFTSIFKPNKQVTSSTIARWIKSVLVKSGISGFGAHSTRSALTSTALEAGLSVKDIMNVADWSNASANFTRRFPYHLMFPLEKQFCNPQIR